MTALDAIGPHEVLRCVPGVRVRLVAKTAGLVRPDSGLQMLNAEHGIGDVTSADILLVTGGDASGPIRDQEVLDWIRRIDRTTKWTTSVSNPYSDDINRRRASRSPREATGQARHSDSA